MRSAHTQILAAIALLLVITAATETRAGTVTWSETRRGDPVDCAPGQQTCVQNLGAANLPADGSLNYGPLSFGNGGGDPNNFSLFGKLSAADFGGLGANLIVNSLSLKDGNNPLGPQGDVFSLGISQLYQWYLPFVIANEFISGSCNLAASLAGDSVTLIAKVNGTFLPVLFGDCMLGGGMSFSQSGFKIVLGGNPLSAQLSLVFQFNVGAAGQTITLPLTSDRDMPVPSSLVLTITGLCIVTVLGYRRRRETTSSA